MKKRTNWIWLSSMAALLFPGLIYPAQGGAPTVQAILGNLKSTFAMIEDYSVQIVVETDIERVHIPRMEIKVFFKQPDKIHLQSNGFAMLPRDGMFINPGWFNEREFYVSILGRETIQNKETFKLELVPRREDIKVRKLVIWVDPSRWIILKIDTITWRGQSVEVEFQYKKYLDRYWLPVTASARIDLSAFKGFSSFHDRPDSNWGGGDDSAGRKGQIFIRFFNYRINEGIPDSIFQQDRENRGRPSGFPK